MRKMTRQNPTVIFLHDKFFSIVLSYSSNNMKTFNILIVILISDPNRFLLLILHLMFHLLYSEKMETYELKEKKSITCKIVPKRIHCMYSDKIGR